MKPHELTYLKVKQKHIATEKNIIRQQELKWAERARISREKAGQEAKKKSRYLKNLIDKGKQLAVLTNPDDQAKALEVSNYYLERVKGLYEHRIDVVRPEARATNIAYGYLLGRKYCEVENTVLENNFARLGLSPVVGKQKLWQRVAKIVFDFGSFDNMEDAAREVKAWRKEHPQYREMNRDDLALAG